MHDSKVKKQAAHKFLKNGNEGKHTKLFDNLPDAEKNFWLNKVSKEYELPVIIHLKDKNWILVTTRRVYWGKGQRTGKIEISEIEGFQVNLKKFRKDGGKPGKIDRLEIETQDGEIAVLHCEPGLPHTGLLVALRILILKN